MKATNTPVRDLRTGGKPVYVCARCGIVRQVRDEKKNPRGRLCGTCRNQPLTSRFDGSWMDQARCLQDDPELFSSRRSEQDAKEVCVLCTVADACLRYALDNDIRDGVYGAKTAAERRQISKEAS